MAQAFEFEGGDNGHEDGVALGSHGSRGGLGRAGIGLQGFVKDLHWPPFLGGCSDFIIVEHQVSPSTIADKPVAVAAPKAVNK